MPKAVKGIFPFFFPPPLFPKPPSSIHFPLGPLSSREREREIEGRAGGKKRKRKKNQLNAANIVIGVLVECDPSIKAIILKIDHESHDYIIEDLDDETLVIKESMLPRLKARLDEVCFIPFPSSPFSSFSFYSAYLLVFPARGALHLLTRGIYVFLLIFDF